MKSTFGLALLSTILLTGCVKYASGYQKSGGGGGGGAAEANPDETAGEGEDGATGDETAGGEETGDSTAANLLSACESCHAAGQSAEKVVLDSSAIPKLNDALTGRTKTDHEAVADSFAEPTRADLEAEMTAIGLRLRGK